MSKRSEYTCDCPVIHRETLDDVIKNYPDIECVEKLAVFFKCLGDFSRIRIVLALRKNDMCVCDLASLLNNTKSAVSHQLRILREKGIVKRRKAGKMVYYSLNDEHVKSIVETALEHMSHELILDDKNESNVIKINKSPYSVKCNSIVNEDGNADKICTCLSKHAK